MIIYTIGFTKKSAEEFFETLIANQIEMVIDVRLNNKSQLAGFSKGQDLKYFLRKICNASYVHCEEYAPSKDLLDRYHKGITSWEEYVIEYQKIMTVRGGHLRFMNRFKDYSSVCLLCSEETPEKCHRRLLAEMIAKSAQEKVKIVHL